MHTHCARGSIMPTRADCIRRTPHCLIPACLFPNTPSTLPTNTSQSEHVEGLLRSCIIVYDMAAVMTHSGWVDIINWLHCGTVHTGTHPPELAPVAQRLLQPPWSDDWQSRAGGWVPLKILIGDGYAMRCRACCILESRCVCSSNRSLEKRSYNRKSAPE